MLVNVLRANKRKLGRGAALLLLTGMAAGCSSQSARFGTIDDIFTGSTDNQRQIIKGNTPQTYPGDTGAVAATPVAPMHTGSVNRSSLPPVTAQPYPDPVAAAPVAAAPPVRVAERQDSTQLNAPARKPLLDRATQTTAEAKPSTGKKAEKPAEKLPLPVREPATAEAVVPKPPKAKDLKLATADAPASSGKKVEPIAAKKPEAPEKKVASSNGGYTVKSGDTLSKIARETGVSVVALKSANGIKDGGLKIGQSLKLPAAGPATAKVAAVDKTITASTAPAAKVATEATTAEYTPPKKADKVIDDAEASKEVAPNATGIGKMRWPVRGRVVSGYGKGSGKANDGIDIAVPEGTAVKAAENGVVIYAGDGLKDFGNTVLVRHENGLVTVYGNASSLNVKRGERVKRGQEIAVSGMTGNADSPKLHFEVRKNSAPVDPSTFLE